MVGYVTMGAEIVEKASEGDNGCWFVDGTLRRACDAMFGSDRNPRTFGFLVAQHRHIASCD
eukprot:10491373-Lingulodinium_polyedra.AAC.1